MRRSKKQLPLMLKLWLQINGSYGLVSIFVFVFGVLMAYGIVTKIDFNEVFYLQGNTEIGKGEVISVTELNYSINGEEIDGYNYVFHSTIGDLNGISYDLGYTQSSGDIVDVQYNISNPEIHRISAMTNTPGGMKSLAFFIIFVIGSVMLLFNINKGKAKYRILETGEIAEGSLIKSEATIVRINNMTVYKLTFRFRAKNGNEYLAFAKNHITTKLEDEPTEKIIYKPSNPNQALVVDNLPWGVPKYVKSNWS